ncbi:MAG: hypothetical protein RJB38_635 [Pseudomonadota bacterium]|jgi:hypothetical protein
MSPPSPRPQIRYFRPPRFFDIFKRVAWLAIGGYFAGFLLMGVLASDPQFEKQVSQHIPISPSPFSLTGSGLARAQSVHALFFHFMTHVPEPCSDDSRAQNDFQRSQCRQFWSRLQELGWIGSIPFVLSGLILFFAWDGIRNRFKKARQKIKKGKTIGLGIVTDPAEAAPDRTAWWHGLQCITVQVADGKQVMAYLPPESPMPSPGEKVSLYEWAKSGSQTQYFAVLYAPHVAVLQGG